MSNYLPIRILIADDHELLLDGLRELINKQEGMECVGYAFNGRQLVQLTEQLMPDVVITDIQMPEMSGAEATSIITTRYPMVCTIAYSLFHSDHYIIEMLSAGARGYVSKSAGKEEIISAIYAVNRSQHYFCSISNARVSKLIASKNIEPGSFVATAIFTEKELKVISHICSELTNKEIAEEMRLSRRSVESYRERILKKTNSKNVAGVILYAIYNNLLPGNNLYTL